jgi:capsular polysaccharide biosynthesis protein
MNEQDAVLRGIFEPPSGLVLTAISRHKWLVGLCAIVVALIAGAYAATRARTYTAATTLQVGQVNPNSPGFYSYVQSAAALATAFSRAIAAEPVLMTVQRTLHLSPSVASARLSAEPLPQSPAFRVVATGPSVSAAIALANVTANAVVAYEGQSNSANPEAASLLQEYQRASLALQRTAARLTRLERANPHSASTITAKAERDTASAKLTAIGQAYSAAVTSQAPRSGLVTLLANATTATDNRRSKLEIYGFVGLLVGLLTGSGIAVAREWRRLRLIQAHRVQLETLQSEPV